MICLVEGRKYNSKWIHQLWTEKSLNIKEYDPVSC